MAGGLQSTLEPYVPDDLPSDPSVSYNPARARVTQSEVRLPSDPGKAPETVLDPSPGSGSHRTTGLPPLKESDFPDPPDAQVYPRSSGYSLNHIVGRGGFGEVWKTYQKSLGRFIAAKRLRDDIYKSHSPTSAEGRFLESVFQCEAIIMGALEHPNVLPIYDLTIDDDGRPMIAMKLVRGRQWNTLLRSERGTQEEEYIAKHLPILTQVAQAVAFAHSRGIVHRDIKPSQVMVGEFGEVLLMDWGMAMVFDMDLARGDDESLPALDILPTRETAPSPSGTVAFMAPEQTLRTARETGPWTDVYLLGATLFYILTGAPPHSSEDSAEAFVMASVGAIVMPTYGEGQQQPPEELMDLALRAMQIRPEDRVPTVKAFLTGLQDYLSGAGRRREAATLIEVVERRLKEANGDYRALTDLSSQLSRARVLWPANPGYPPLREAVVLEFARAAISNGDLVLARVQAERLRHEGTRNALMVEINQRQMRSAWLKVQRRVLLVATALLLFGVAFGSYRILERNRAVETFDRVNALRSAENQLAERLALNIALPSTLAEASSPRQTTPGQKADYNALMKQRQILREERESLAENPMVSNRLESEPFPLLLAEANLLVAEAASRDDYPRAYEIYRQANAARPGSAAPLVGMGYAAFLRGNPDLATRHLEEAAEIVRERSGARSPEYARLLALTAEAYRDSGDRADSYKTYYRRSLEILETNWAELSLKLALYRRLLGDYRRGVEYARGIEPVTKEYLKTADPIHMNAFNEYALGMFMLAEYQELEPLIEAELAERVQNFGQESLPVANALWHRGRVRARTSRRDLGIDDWKTALAIREKLLPADDPEIASILNDIADVLLFVGQYSKGQEKLPSIVAEGSAMLERALAIRETAYGIRHPRVAETLRLLADYRAAQSRHFEAREMRRRADTILKESLAADHPAMGQAYRDLARQYRATGRFSESDKLLQQALAVREGSLGPVHTEVARVLQMQALLDTTLGRYDQAYTTLMREYEIATTAQGTFPQTKTLGMVYRGDVRAAEGRFAEAEEIYREAMDVLYGLEVTNEHIHRRLAAIYALQGRMDEAREQAGTALRNRFEDLKIDNPESALYFDNIGELCILLGLDEEARLLYLRNSEYSRKILPARHVNALDSTLYYLELELKRNERSDLANFHLVVANWLRESWEGRAEASITCMSNPRESGWIRAQCEMADALRAIDPALARPFAVRAALLARIARISDGHPIMARVGRLLKQTGPASEPALTMEIPADLWPDLSQPISSEKLGLFIEDNAPTGKNWKYEVSGVKNWNIESVMEPSGEELQRQCVDLLTRLIETASPYPAMPGRIATPTPQ